MSAAVSQTPTSLGYAMPAEWEPQEAVWLSWPAGDPEIFPGTKARVEAVFAEIAAAISRFEKVRVNSHPGRFAEIRRLAKASGANLEQLELHGHENNDVWCRDHGPIFLRHRSSGEVAATNWGFNGWGDKFGPYDLDNAIPRKIAGVLGMKCFDAPMILEGGSIEVNRFGQLLTTEAVLLNPNRNPHLSRREIESALRDWLGVSEIFWLGRGIEGDDTDGHIDDVARFAGDGVILLTTERDSASPNHAVLEENYERLQDFRLPGGSRPEIVRIDMPDPCLAPGWRLPVLPATYVNFLILNGAVLAPVFGQKKRDTAALGLLGELFPDREIVPVNVLDIVKEGGAIHCLTQQQPAGPSRREN